MSSANPAVQLDWVSLTGNFLLVIVLLVAVLWALRRIQGIKGLQGLRPVARRLSVVEALTVGPRQKLAIVRLDDREVLVGVTPTGFTLLDTLPPKPAMPAGDDAPPGATSGPAASGSGAMGRGVLA